MSLVPGGTGELTDVDIEKIRGPEISRYLLFRLWKNRQSDSSMQIYQGRPLIDFIRTYEFRIRGK